MPRKGTPASTRMEGKFSRGDGCWEWTAYRNPDGYGEISENGKSLFAHRVAYEMWVGPIPDGFQIDHIVCDNKGCVRPDHLTISTLQANTLRWYEAQTHCPSGHEYTSSDVRTRNGKTSKDCKQCNRIRNRKNSAINNVLRASYKAQWQRDNRAKKRGKKNA